MTARIVRIVALMVIAIVLAGFAYERVARARDGERHPAPGRLIDIGSHHQHIVCTGFGAPTIVLEAGLGESSTSWAVVQRDLARTSRVCAYDRAGLAWSDPSPTPRTARRAAEELRTLLETANESAPYVLVAHSLGAFVSRLFIERFPEDVVGLVLIDPTSEEAVIAAGPPGVAIIEHRIYAALSEIGLLRFVGRALVNESVGGNAPAEVLDAVPFLYGPRSQIATTLELDASVESAKDVRAVSQHALKDMQLVVISSADATATERERHQMLALLSSRGRHDVAPAGGHYVHYDNIQWVVDLIREVVASSCSNWDRRAA